MNIRSATLNDIDGIRAVGIASWHDTYSGIVPDNYISWALEKWWMPEILKRYVMSDQFIVLVAERNGNIIGMAHAQIRSDKTAILWRLYIEQMYRGQGIGTQLMKEIQDQLPAEVQWLYIEYYQQNKRAETFYADQGFVFDRQETTSFEGVPIVSVFVKRAIQ